MKKEPNLNRLEKTKLCPYCMGDIPLDAIKCEHCGEWVKEKKERRRRVRREENGSDKEEILKDEGIQIWKASQSTIVKAILVLVMGLITSGGVYLAADPNHDILGTDSVDQVVLPNTSEGDCTFCDGYGKLICSNCNGTGEIEIVEDCPYCINGIAGADGEICNECDGTEQVTKYYTCEECDGTGYVQCTNCGGDGKIE